MSERDRNARVAGALYLIAIVLGVLFLEILPDGFVKPDDAAATARNIAAQPELFRTLIAGDMITGVVWLAVVLALYRLLENVDRTQAWLMLILGAFLQVPLYFGNVVNYVAPLLLVTGGASGSAFSMAQRDEMAMLFLRLHNYELLASFVFAGLWLFPFGILVYKSGFLPRSIGVWLVLNGLAWTAVSLTAFIAPRFSDAVRIWTTPLTFGEFAITFWLLVFGAHTLPWRRLAPD